MAKSQATTMLLMLTFERQNSGRAPGILKRLVYMIIHYECVNLQKIRPSIKYTVFFTIFTLETPSSPLSTLCYTSFLTSIPHVLSQYRGDIPNIILNFSAHFCAIRGQEPAVRARSVPGRPWQPSVVYVSIYVPFDSFVTFKNIYVLRAVKIVSELETLLTYFSSPFCFINIICGLGHRCHAYDSDTLLVACDACSWLTGIDLE